VKTTHSGRHARALVAVGALAVLAAIAVALVGASASKASSSPAGNRITVNPQFVGPMTSTPGAQDMFGCQNDPINSTVFLRCYSPQQIQQAYGYAPLLKKGIDGTGRTIVIVDAFQNPYIKSDLKLQDKVFGLPDPPSFTTIAPQGVPAFDPSNPDMVDWGAETTLDVLWSHAMAPGANIVLVEAKSDMDRDLYNAEAYAVSHHLGDVMSQSFGENEACVGVPGDPTVFAQWQTLFRTAANQNWSVFASSGDSGASQFNCAGTAAALAPGFPASDPYVTGVGGTTLNATNDPTGNATSPTSGTYVGETSWTEGGDLFGIFCNPPDEDDVNCSGGGFSTLFSRPFYQPVSSQAQGSQRYARGVPDVSYNAGVNGGVLTVCSVCNGGVPGVFLFGGTSAGSPQWAALTADADQMAGHDMGLINPALYFIAGSGVYNLAFHDVKTGNNTVMDLGGAGYQATKGWDPATGLGSPNASILLPDLVAVNSIMH
jgi:subtilase family serine protease